MANANNTAQDRFSEDLFNLLCAIIRREMSRPPYEPKFDMPPYCPWCDSARTSKRGHDATGKQRYQCTACKRSFTATTGSTLSSTNIPLDTWLVFARCHVAKRTLRDSAAYCNVSLKTAFYMRKRLNTAIQKYAAQIRRRLHKPTGKWNS